MVQYIFHRVDCIYTDQHAALVRASDWTTSLQRSRYTVVDHVAFGSRIHITKDKENVRNYYLGSVRRTRVVSRVPFFVQGDRDRSLLALSDRLAITGENKHACQCVC